MLLYVIYTGNRKTRPGEISFSEEFFGGRKTAVEVRVKMIYDSREGDIINQYVNFTRIYNQQIREHGNSLEDIADVLEVSVEMVEQWLELARV